MTDVFTPEKRSDVMRRVKGRDTGPERRVRTILRSAGIGYRLGGQGLAGRPDLVMKGRRIVVFVHGCFWHGHACPRGGRKPKANAAYWQAKIARNRARDAAAALRLGEDGWAVITVWECALREAGFEMRLLAAVAAGQAATISGAASSLSD